MAGDRWGRIIIQNDVPPPRRLHDNRFGRAVCQLHTRRIEIEPFSLSLSLSLARSRLWNWMDRFYRCARIKRRVDTVSFSSTKTGKLFPARENELRWKKKEKKRKEKLAAWLFSRDESSLRKVEPHTTKVATTYRSHSMERLARFRALER